MSTSKWKWVSINSNNSGNSRSESGIISLPVEVKRRHVLVNRCTVNQLLFACYKPSRLSR